MDTISEDRFGGFNPNDCPNSWTTVTIMAFGHNSTR